MKYMKRALKILKKIKLKTLILLIILLMFNSYAWFIYATKVSMQFNAHIESWNIDFRTGEEETVTNLVFSVDRVYPGMEDYIQEVEVENKGEMSAKISYEINSVRILDTTYTRDEDTTSDELEKMIEEEYPFTITIGVDSNAIQEGGEATYRISLVWPFESGDDEKDTEWGNAAYEYYATHANTTSINLEIKLIATQESTT